MKKRMLLLAFVVAIASMPSMTFALEDVKVSTQEICGVDELKCEMERLRADGNLSSEEKSYLMENTEEEVVAEFVGEKMDAAVDLINDTAGSNVLMTLPGGHEYKCETYDLGDGCHLIVELEDRAEGENDNINTRATSGSNTLWKEYGKRYFTASATVMFSLGSATLKLRNHYTLSSKGIDERYGVESFIVSTANGSVSATEPKITDATARTVGASDVNMECQFTLKYSEENGFSMKKQYVMESTVGFVDIDKSAEKVKVKQSWKLTKI